MANEVLQQGDRVEHQPILAGSAQRRKEIRDHISCNYSNLSAAEEWHVGGYAIILDHLIRPAVAISNGL